MINERKKSYKSIVQKYFPKAECVSEEKGTVITFKVLSKEPKGKRILGRGTSAWSAWKHAAETNHAPKPVVIPRMNPVKQVRSQDTKTTTSIPSEDQLREVQISNQERYSAEKLINAELATNSVIREVGDIEKDEPVVSEKGVPAIIWISLVIAIGSVILWWYYR